MKLWVQCILKSGIIVLKMTEYQLRVMNGLAEPRSEKNLEIIGKVHWWVIEDCRIILREIKSEVGILFHWCNQFWLTMFASSILLQNSYWESSLPIKKKSTLFCMRHAGMHQYWSWFCEEKYTQRWNLDLFLSSWDKSMH